MTSDDSPCPHCGELPREPLDYRYGTMAAQRIITKSAGDQMRIASWLKFIDAIRRIGVPQGTDVALFLDGLADALTDSVNSSRP